MVFLAPPKKIEPDRTVICDHFSGSLLFYFCFGLRRWYMMIRCNTCLHRYLYIYIAYIYIYIVCIYIYISSWILYCVCCLSPFGWNTFVVYCFQETNLAVEHQGKIYQQMQEIMWYSLVGILCWYQAKTSNEIVISHSKIFQPGKINISSNFKLLK